MDTSIEIRKASRDDFKAIKQLKLDSLKESPLAYDTSYEEAIEWFDDKWNDYCEEASDPKLTLLYIAWHAEKPVGHIRLDLKQKKKKKHVAEFDVLHVSPDYRRKGIAKKLFDGVMNDLKKSHPEVIKVQLSVYEMQVEALNFYEKLGFKVYGEFDKELLVDGKYYKQYMMDLFL